MEKAEYYLVQHTDDQILFDAVQVNQSALLKVFPV